MQQTQNKTFIGTLGEEYFVERIIAKKSNCCLFKASSTALGHDIVLKVFLPEAEIEFKNEKQYNEALIQSSAIVKASKCMTSEEVQASLKLGNIEFKKFSYLEMPFFKHGSVIQFLMNAAKKGHTLSSETRQYLFKQQVRALFQLHQVNRIAHCDIKPDNFIIQDDFTLGLIDFGQSSQADFSKEGICGTEEYLPPEVRQQRYHTFPYDPKKADIFALGMCLFLLKFGQMPFAKATPDDPLYQYIYSGNVQQFLTLHPATAGLTQYQNDLELLVLLQCLNPNPTVRPSIQHLILVSFVALAPNEPTESIAAELAHILLN